MTEQDRKHNNGFYCNVSFADRESDCICNRIVGYDARTDIPRVDMTKEEWAYLYNGTISDELKLDTGSTANTTICNEMASVDNEKRFFCINCSKFTEHEYVSSDSNDRPSVHHKNGHKHTVMFGSDIQRLLEPGTSYLDQITRYETAEMYGISVEKLDQILASVRGDL